MILPDSNLLLYAYNQESPFHAGALAWWQNCLGGTETVALTAVTAFGFVRVATQARIFRSPMTIGEAARALRMWLARASVEWIEGGPRHAEQTLRLLEACGTAGDLVSDAQIAALAIENNAVIHTADADFSRFPGVRWRNPLTGAEGRLSRPGR